MGKYWLRVPLAMGLMAASQLSVAVELDVPAAQSSHDAEITQLGRDFELAEHRLKLAQAEFELNTLQEMRGDGVGAARSGPTLVGVFAGPVKSYAEFVVGDTVRRVEVGGVVADGVRLRGVGEGYAVIEGSAGRETVYVTQARRRNAAGQAPR